MLVTVSLDGVVLITNRLTDGCVAVDGYTGTQSRLFSG